MAHLLLLSSFPGHSTGSCAQRSNHGCSLGNLEDDASSQRAVMWLQLALKHSLAHPCCISDLDHFLLAWALAQELSNRVGLRPASAEDFQEKVDHGETSGSLRLG